LTIGQERRWNLLALGKDEDDFVSRALGGLPINKIGVIAALYLGV